MALEKRIEKLEHGEESASCNSWIRFIEISEVLTTETGEVVPLELWTLGAAGQTESIGYWNPKTGKFEQIDTEKKSNAVK